jgi:hypothetical protein
MTGTRIIEIEVTEPLADWIELEARDDETVSDYIERAIRLHLDVKLPRMEAREATVELPQPLLERAMLKYQDQQALGYDPDMDELLFNHVTFDVQWTTENGNPIQWTTNDD